MPDLKQTPHIRAVTIAIVRNQQEALQIKQKLEAGGIECFQSGERSIATDKSTRRELNAVKVQVARSDVQRALSILSVKHNAVAGKPHAKSAKKTNRTPRTPKRVATHSTAPAMAVALIILAAVILFLL